MDQGTAGTARMVEEHGPLVRSIATRIKARLPAEVELDDLVGYGQQGLLEAAQRYDPRQGAAFSTFAYYRIRGAIYDGLRTLGWLSRGDYAQARADERATAYLAQLSERQAGLRASDVADGGSSYAVTEGSTRLREEVAGLAETLATTAAIYVISLERMTGFEPADESQPEAPERLAAAEHGQAVRQAMAELPERERRLLELCYFEDCSLKQAGGKLGLSRSWASRLHARAIERLRKNLERPNSSPSDATSAPACR